MPYILPSTLRRMSTISTISNASSGLSSGSASSDGPSCLSSQESVPASLCCLFYLPFHPVQTLLTFKMTFVFLVWKKKCTVYASDSISASFTNSSLLSRPRDRRASVLSRSDEDNRIARKNRKEWSVSKSQNLLERQSDGDEVRPYAQELFTHFIFLLLFLFPFNVH